MNKHPSSQSNRKLKEEEMLDSRIEYTNHIINTHFNTFVYIDTKLQALLSISAFILAATTFVYTSGAISNKLSIILFTISGFCQLIAISFCLWHIKPRMDAKVGNNINPRTVVGTTPFTKTEYIKNIESLTKKNMLTFNSSQIYGLSHIHKKGAAALFRASIFNAIGIIFLVAAFILNTIPSTDDQTSSCVAQIEILSNLN